VGVVVTLLAYGCPVQAIVIVFGLDERTVLSWQSRSGKHCQQVHEHLVEQPPKRRGRPSKVMKALVAQWCN
jgi:translation elongation factor EF-4